MSFVEDAAHEAITNPSRPSNVRRGRNGKARAENKTGLLGAMQAGGRGKFISRIRVNGVIIKLRNKEGKTYFQSAEEAHDAYVVAAVAHGICLSI